MPRLSAQGHDEIKRILKEAVDSGKTPGLVFGATSVDQELCFVPYGPRLVGEPSGGQINSDSLFWLCSQVKMVTSIATLQLIDAGKLHMDTPAETILPQLADPIVLDEHSTPENPRYRPAEGKITIRHLLSHSSGLFYTPLEQRVERYHLSIPYTSSHRQVDPVGHFYDLIKGPYPKIPLKFEPGTSFTYSWAADTLGFIVERVSGQTLEGYYKEHIFGPLGATSPTFYLRSPEKEKLVPLAWREPDGSISPWASQCPVIEQDPEKVHMQLGGAGLYCSMSDYLTLLRHLLQVHDGTAAKPILSAAAVKSMFQPALTPSGEKEISSVFQMETGLSWSTALCINMTDLPDRRRKGSAWWYGWAGTYHFMDPTTGIAAVLGSQMLPTRDAEVLRIWEQIEKVLYAYLTD